MASHAQHFCISCVKLSPYADVSSEYCNCCEESSSHSVLLNELKLVFSTPEEFLAEAMAVKCMCKTRVKGKGMTGTAHDAHLQTCRHKHTHTHKHMCEYTHNLVVTF
jgi:hypothetical protein